MKKLKEWKLLIVMIVLVGIIFLIQHNRIIELEKDLNKVRIVAGKLPENVVTANTLDKHILTQIHRHAGTDSVIVERVYIPTESEVVTTVVLNEEALTQLEQTQLLLWQLKQNVHNSADSARIDSLDIAIHNLRRNLYITEIDFDSHGFCAVPEIGIGCDTDLNPNIEAGVRLYYFNRFGIGVHGAVEIPTDSTESWDGSAGIFFDGRIPGLENTAAYGSILYDFPDQQVKGLVGVHVYLN